MPKPSSNRAQTKRTFDLAIQKLLEIELVLGLGSQLSERQLMCLLAKCYRIVKEQMEMLDSK